MNIRNRATTALLATLGVAALLAPTVSEAAPARVAPGAASAVDPRGTVYASAEVSPGPSVALL